MTNHDETLTDDVLSLFVLEIEKVCNRHGLLIFAGKAEAEGLLLIEKNHGKPIDYGGFCRGVCYLPGKVWVEEHQDRFDEEYNK
jgi:hypothetical protein